jgi:hypothetical protein
VLPDAARSFSRREHQSSKIKLKKVENFRPPKSDRQPTSFHQPFTTNEPQKHLVKTRKFLKTPSKNTNPTTLRKKKKLDPTFYDFWNP